VGEQTLGELAVSLASQMPDGFEVHATIRKDMIVVHLSKSNDQRLCYWTGPPGKLDHYAQQAAELAVVIAKGE
jgi:hypothetical protein